jgi:hypothetical protein
MKIKLIALIRTGFKEYCSIEYRYNGSVVVPTPATK